MSRARPPASLRPRIPTAIAAASVLAAALLAAPTLAAAAQPAVRPRTVVYYSLRDLATRQGVRTLYWRIESAARAVCPSYDARDLEAFADSRACREGAVRRAVRRIADRRLAAMRRSLPPAGR